MSTIPRVIADLEVQLATAISVGSTTFTISPTTDDDGVTIPNGKYCLTIDNGSSNKEYLMGNMTSGVFTSVVSLSRQGASTSGAVRAHRVGASVILTDFVVLQQIANILRGVDTLDGTSPISYDTDPTLSDGKQLATVQYVLDTVSGGTVNFSSQTISGTSGENLAVGDIVYFKEADQRWWKADADVSATLVQVKFGVAQSVSVTGNSVTVLLSGIATGFTSLTPGAKYYVSNTAGGVSATPGTTELFVGWAFSTTTMLTSFMSIYIPTAAEKSTLSSLATAAGIISPYAGRTAPTGYLLCDGSAVSRATYAALFGVIAPSGTFTVTIATPGVFTKVAHGLVAGDKLHFTTTGALPTGLTTNVDYYVISTGLTADDFRVALSPGGAAVNTSGSQSGVHTLYISNFGKGDGSTTFNLPDLRSRVPLGFAAAAPTTQTLSFEPAAVTTGTDLVTILDTVFPSQGQKVQLTSTGTLPAGLSLATDYWIVRTSSTTIKFAASQSDANAATPVVINITDQGTGVHTMTFTGRAFTVLGRMGGEETHGVSVSELASHNHTLNGSVFGASSNGPGSGSAPLIQAPSISNTGGDSQHNNMQPFITLNYIIKT